MIRNGREIQCLQYAGNFSLQYTHKKSSLRNCECKNKFSVDEEVEGNFGGAGDWYKATVKSVNTEWRYYEVFYTGDGVTEQKVKESNLKKLGGSAQSADMGQAQEAKVIACLIVIADVIDWMYLGGSGGGNKGEHPQKSTC